MRPYAKFLLTAAALLISLPLWAQQLNPSPDSDLLARFSYESSLVNRSDRVERVCFAVSDGGDYRLVESLSGPPHQSIRLQGKLSDEEFKQLKSVILDASLRALPKSHGGLIRQESETFAAQIPSGWQGSASTLRVRWLNADGESPFPAPVAKVVKWLKDFQPQLGKQFDYAEFPDVCPLVGLQLLQPSVAANQNP
jgi:hypothetical protein